jgi:hypothetical protein
MLFVDTSADIYGAASYQHYLTEGEGSIFELIPNAEKTRWTRVTLRRFCKQDCLKGGIPNGPSVIDARGNFYGTTLEGGQYNNPNFNCVDFNPTRGCGVLYKLVPDGEQARETVLYDFCSVDNCFDGDFPDGNLSMDSMGNLYGTTPDGGTASSGSNCNFSSYCGGVVFQFGKDGYHVLHNFCSETNCTDGESPSGGVITDAAGDVFGVAGGGGQHRYGTVFELVP